MIKQQKNSLQSFVPTLCQLMSIDAPALATGEALEKVTASSSSQQQKTKALLYCPDAFGWHAMQYFPDLYQRLQKVSTHEVAISAVFPPVTPVCFASLLTGGSPSEHGIQEYRKPILRCDTIFDALARAGKKVALIAIKDSSMATIFQERAIDYFTMDYDPLVTVKALELLEGNKHDVILVYHQEYDDLLHAAGPFAEVSRWALERHVQTYELLVRKVQEVWQKNYVISFTPDHGGHIDLASGLGDHGLDCPEDMDLRHFFVLN